MNRLIFLVLLLISLSQTKAQGQTSDINFQKIIGYLQAEDWKNASISVATCLAHIPAEKDNDDAASILRYMYIFSESGLMNDGRLTQEEAMSAVKSFQGKNIILAGHPISLKEGFKVIELSNNKTDTLFVTASNNNNTNILAFEYIVPAKPISMDDFKTRVGQVCRVRGRLKLISVEGHLLPRYHMIIDDAELVFNN
jgi:hypothetical protein